MRSHPGAFPFLIFLIGVVFLGYCIHAQQYGPVPPRPQQFAGATLVQPPPRSNFRQRPSSPRAVPELIQPVDPAGSRGRRPQPLRKVKAQITQQQVFDQQRTNLVDDVSNPFNNKIVAPTPLPQFQQQPTKLTPRPVEEEINEEEEVGTTIVTTPSTTTYSIPRQSYPPVPAPAPIQPAQVPAGFQRSPYLQPTAFRTQGVQPLQSVQPVQPVQPVQALQPAQYAEPALQGRQLIRQQGRPVQQAQIPLPRQPIQPGVVPQIPGAIPVPDDEQYFRQVQSRPLKKQEPARQQTVEPIRQPLRQTDVIRQQPVRTQQQYVQPEQREPHVKASPKERKPVAQTIRKYHEEHEDGSITWGYENDDGSFKEETIGVDCVTRGKYGYYDPDGVKREYTYQTGIPCDKAQESEEAASNQGFIDYTNNKYVLPNGDEIDLEAMVKNRARKPVSQYRY